MIRASRVLLKECHIFYEWIFYTTFFFSQDNHARMQKLVDKLQNRINVILQGGGEKAVARHTSRGNYLKMRCFKRNT